MAMQSAVTRTVEGNVWGANQKIAAGEALRAQTIRDAYASFEKSREAPSRAANSPTLSCSRALREDPSKLVDLPIERTMVGGRWVFES